LLKAEQWVLHPQNPEFGNVQTASQEPGVTPARSGVPGG